MDINISFRQCLRPTEISNVAAYDCQHYEKKAIPNYYYNNLNREKLEVESMTASLNFRKQSEYLGQNKV